MKLIILLMFVSPSGAIAMVCSDVIVGSPSPGRPTTLLSRGSSLQGKYRGEMDAHGEALTWKFLGWEDSKYRWKVDVDLAAVLRRGDRGDVENLDLAFWAVSSKGGRVGNPFWFRRVFGDRVARFFDFPQQGFDFPSISQTRAIAFETPATDSLVLKIKKIRAERGRDFVVGFYKSGSNGPAPSKAWMKRFIEKDELPLAESPSWFGLHDQNYHFAAIIWDKAFRDYLKSAFELELGFERWVRSQTYIKLEPPDLRDVLERNDKRLEDTVHPLLDRVTGVGGALVAGTQNILFILNRFGNRLNDSDLLNQHQGGIRLSDLNVETRRGKVRVKKTDGVLVEDIFLALRAIYYHEVISKRKDVNPILGLETDFREAQLLTETYVEQRLGAIRSAVQTAR